MRMDSGLRPRGARSHHLGNVQAATVFTAEAAEALLVTPAIGARTTGCQRSVCPASGAEESDGCFRIHPYIVAHGANREPDSAEGVQERSASSATVRRRRSREGTRERGGGHSTPRPSVASASQQAQYREPTRHVNRVGSPSTEAVPARNSTSVT